MARGGAASSSTASACVYYATTGMLVALCVAGGYFLTWSLAAAAEGEVARRESKVKVEVGGGGEDDAAALVEDPHGNAKPDEGEVEVERRREEVGEESVVEETESEEEEKSLDGGVEEEKKSLDGGVEEEDKSLDGGVEEEKKSLDGGVEEKSLDGGVEEKSLDGGVEEEESNAAEKRVEAEAQEGEMDDEETRSIPWRVCNVKSGADYIPCLDNDKAIKKLRPDNYRRYEHRERHCPNDGGPTCLVPLPAGYRRPVEWPESRGRIWYSNVPHSNLVQVKGHQNWVKVSGRHLTFPGGGTQFIHGALHYIDFLQRSSRGTIAWGKRTRVVLDVGCGVASFGGYLFERDVVTMSFAPKDEHEAQVQMALERGIPAISAVMGSKRLPFPSNAFDLVHCARCRVPWHANNGALLLELNRVLRPGGLFVWSATPVYQKLTEDVHIWKAMSGLTRSMCWDLVSINKDRLNGVGIALYRKPASNKCYESRTRQQPPMCGGDDDPNAAWYVRLNSCMHRASAASAAWPADWPRRLAAVPKAAGATADSSDHLNGLGIRWDKVRNVMDMRATYGGFAAALRDKKLWVMNVVNVDAPDTLPIIFHRGLLGIYHDWCESFSTYPRTYDLLHADHLFSRIKGRCAILPLVVEVDRIVRPGGSIILRDQPAAIAHVQRLLKSLHWDVRLIFYKDDPPVLYAEKSNWRPDLIDEPS